jgi:hypothetical protein
MGGPRGVPRYQPPKKLAIEWVPIKQYCSKSGDNIEFYHEKSKLTGPVMDSIYDWWVWDNSNREWWWVDPKKYEWRKDGGSFWKRVDEKESAVAHAGCKESCCNKDTYQVARMEKKINDLLTSLSELERMEVLDSTRAINTYNELVDEVNALGGLVGEVEE